MKHSAKCTLFYHIIVKLALLFLLETLMLNSILKPAYPRTKSLSFCPRSLKIIIFPRYTRILIATHNYTYVTARSRIDHVLVERTSTHLCTKYSVANPHDIIISDHLPLYFTIDYAGERKYNAPKPNVPKNINWSKCNTFHLSQYNNEIEVQVTKLFSTHKIGDLTP